LPDGNERQFKAKTDVGSHQKTLATRMSKSFFHLSASFRSTRSLRMNALLINPADENPKSLKSRSSTPTSQGSA
jgi:hypothetical protein